MKWHLAGALILCSVLTVNSVIAADQPFLYKTSFIQAAPGKLLELIRLFQDRMAVYDGSGDERPLWWRHTQGDKWDLMMLFPMGSYTEFYSPDRVAKRKKAADGSALPQDQFARKLQECVAWREDLFVQGPPLDLVKKTFNANAYYHIEIMAALPGKEAELRKEREMESAYQKGIGRPEWLIFTRDQGAAWDIFTLGCYQDLKQWAVAGETSKEKREAAAKAVGFPDSDSIGPYMRTLISMHRDTMGVAIKQ
jgi:hypothetical protein